MKRECRICEAELVGPAEEYVGVCVPCLETMTDLEEHAAHVEANALNAFEAWAPVDLSRGLS